jgi:hypothetical protein
MPSSHVPANKLVTFKNFTPALSAANESTSLSPINKAWFGELSPSAQIKHRGDGFEAMLAQKNVGISNPSI